MNRSGAISISPDHVGTPKTRCTALKTSNAFNCLNAPRSRYFDISNTPEAPSEHLTLSLYPGKGSHSMTLIR